MPQNDGIVLYCPDCGWVDDTELPYPIQEIRLVQVTRLVLREEDNGNKEGDG